MEIFATIQKELLRVSQVQQNMFSALQILVAVKTNDLPKCIDLPVKTLLDLKTLEKNIQNKEYAQSVVRFYLHIYLKYGFLFNFKHLFNSFL